MHTQSIIAGLLTLTAFSSYINHKFFRLPKTIGLTLLTFGFSLGILILMSMGSPWAHVAHAHAMRFVNAVAFDKTFLHGMLGFLLFAGALHIDISDLAKHKWMIVLLATVSVLLSTLIVGFGCWYFFTWLGIELSLPYCLLFGALISPTDPIAALGIMRNLKVPQDIEMKIAGEALFNDAMGIVLFVVMVGMSFPNTETYTASEIFALLGQQALGGALWGSVLGLLSARLLRTVESFEVAVLVHLAVVTSGYALAETTFEVSGVIAIVCSGLIIGHQMRHCMMTKQTRERLQGFWSVVDELMNAMLFVLIGLEFISLNFSVYSVLASIGCVCIVIAARFISVSLPILWLSVFRRSSRHLVWMMTWGGMRGGISIALALSISPHIPERGFILAITYAVVLFSIIVQGLTMGPVIRTILDHR